MTEESSYFDGYTTEHNILTGDRRPKNAAQAHMIHMHTEMQKIELPPGFSWRIMQPDMYFVQQVMVEFTYQLVRDDILDQVHTRVPIQMLTHGDMRGQLLSIGTHMASAMFEKQIQLKE